MYSNEKRGFSILDIIVKIILFGLFIFILVWLFNKKVPNMTPFYSNVFRENIRYMQEAAESYFTDDKMPGEIGGEVKMTLSEMLEKKLLLPFVDKDGNSCDLYNSYVTITKQVDESYILKTNLECGSEKDYTIKVLGCHTYCPNNNCEKVCKIEKLTSYQYKKLVTNTSTKYSCPSGYSLNGKKCNKSVLIDTKSAEIKTLETKTYVEDALVKVTPEVKTLLQTIKTKNKNYVEKITTPNYTQLTTIKTPNYKELTTTVTPEKKYTDRIETKVEEKETCTEVTTKESYSCNCTGSWNKGQYVSTCSTCDRYVTTEDCTTTPASTTYSCPSGYTPEGSGSSLKCYKYVNTYSCPSGTDDQKGSGSSLKCYDLTSYTYSCPSGTDDQKGSGSSLKCYDLTSYTYSCPTGTIKEGSGSSLKCYTISYTYSCPAGTDYQTGSNSTLKCYDITPEKRTYYCKDNTWTINGTKCSKTVKEENTVYYCEDGYKLEGNKCNKYSTESIEATGKKVTSSYYKYTWSTKTSLEGWERTGKTKTVDGKEICE